MITTLATVATIATPATAGERRVGGTPEELEQRLTAGEWLRPGDVAILLDVDRRTVDRMLRADPPLLRFRLVPGTGRHRQCHPEDVRRILDQRRRVHGG